MHRIAEQNIQMATSVGAMKQTCNHSDFSLEGKMDGILNAATKQHTIRVQSRMDGNLNGCHRAYNQSSEPNEWQPQWMSQSMQSEFRAK